MSPSDWARSQVERVATKAPQHVQALPPHLMAQVMAAWQAELDAEQDRLYEAIQARKSATAGE